MGLYLHLYFQYSGVLMLQEKLSLLAAHALLLYGCDAPWHMLISVNP